MLFLSNVLTDWVDEHCMLKVRPWHTSHPRILKLVRTLLNYRVLGTSITAIFLSNHHSLYEPIYLWWMHAWFHLYGTSQPARSSSKAIKCKIKNSCPQWDSNPQPWELKSNALTTDELIRLWWKICLNRLYTNINFWYQCIHVYIRINSRIIWSPFCLVDVLFCVSYWTIDILYK